MVEQDKHEVPTGDPVVVTTARKGVFFGYLDDDYVAGTPVLTLLQARMCVYWSASVRGVLGLAATGPDAQCKTTPPVPSITLDQVSAVMRATPEAVTAWQKGHWS